MNEIHYVLGAIQIDRAERKASPLDANAENNPILLDVHCKLRYSYCNLRLDFADGLVNEAWRKDQVFA